MITTRCSIKGRYFAQVFEPSDWSLLPVYISIPRKQKRKPGEEAEKINIVLVERSLSLHHLKQFQNSTRVGSHHHFRLSSPTDT